MPDSLAKYSNQALASELTRLAGHINAAEHRFLTLLAELIEREAWEGGSGIKSPAHWLNYYCGIDLGAAREKVRVAKALRNLPDINKAFSAGEISYSKVRAMTRCATPGNEAVLVSVAKYGTAEQMEKLVRQHRRVARLNRYGQTRHQARQVTFHYDEDGMLVLNARFTPEEGAVILKALQAAMDTMKCCSKSACFQKEVNDKNCDVEKFPRKCADGAEPQKEPVSGAEKTFPQNRATECGGNISSVEPSPEICSGSENSAESRPSSAFEAPAGSESTESNSTGNVSAETPLQQVSEPTFPQQRADSLVRVAEHFLATVKSSNGEPANLSNGDKYQVMVHINAGCKGMQRHSRLPGHASLENGPCLEHSTLRRLACDASLVPVLRDDSGDVLNIGRKSRAVPPAIRRALTIRDGGCRYPGCTQTHYVDAHHIHHWCDGGETSLDNLVLLCRHHHRLLHENGFEIIRQGRNEFRFVGSNGREMKQALYPQFERSQSDETIKKLESENRGHGAAIDSRTAVTRWDGERMDLDHTLGLLFDLSDMHIGGQAGLQ